MVPDPRSIAMLSLYPMLANGYVPQVLPWGKGPAELQCRTPILIKFNITVCFYSLYQTLREPTKKQEVFSRKKQARQADCSSAYAIYDVQSDQPPTMSLLCLLRYVLQVG